MTKKVKGMVQLAGVTYRIVRIATGAYSVVRIADDCEVGSFQTVPTLSVEASVVAPALLREIARLAIHLAKTSYIAFRAPVSAPRSEGSPVMHPSSVPPPLPAT